MKQGRVPGLDILRCLAILFVVFHHYDSPLGGSLWTQFFEPVFSVLWSGVDLFFVLSGFLIANQWLQSLEKDPIALAYKKFYIKRAFRILPNYWIALGIYGLQAFFLTKRDFDLWSYLLFLQNLLDLPIFVVSWSLCVEEHFYLLFPMTGFLLWKVKKPWAIYLAGLSTLGFTIYLRHCYWTSHIESLYESLPLSKQNFGSMLSYYKGIYFPTYTRLDGLTCGVLLATIKNFRPSWWAKLTSKGNALSLAGSIGLLASFFLVHDKYSWSASVLGFFFLAVSFSCLVVAASTDKSWLGRLQIPGAQHMALLSFSMYLLFPAVLVLMSFITRYLSIFKIDLLYLSMEMFLLLGLSQLLYWLVEKPSLRIRQKLINRLQA